MRSVINIIKHKYFAVSATIMVLMLPLFIFVNQQQQDGRSKAEASSTLSFNPTAPQSSPLVKKSGETFSLDVIVNPGKNLISLLKLDIEYDPNVINLSSNNPIIVNPNSFPEILQGPVYSNGRVQIILSVGSDLSKAISTQTKAATINFVASGSSNETSIKFGGNNAIYSVAKTDGKNENVLSSTEPVYLKIE